jgi:hypothetical protein
MTKRFVFQYMDQSTRVREHFVNASSIDAAFEYAGYFCRRFEFELLSVDTVKKS